MPLMTQLLKMESDYQADEVEIVAAKHEDGWRLWINVGGENRLRIYRIKHLTSRGEVWIDDTD